MLVVSFRGKIIKDLVSFRVSKSFFRDCAIIIGREVLRSIGGGGGAKVKLKGWVIEIVIVK